MSVPYRFRIVTLLALLFPITGCALYMPYRAPVTSAYSEPARTRVLPPTRSDTQPAPREQDPTEVRQIQHGFSVSVGSQRMCYFASWQPVLCGDISTGSRPGWTPQGTFRVQGKQRFKRSSLYPRPRGGAIMPYSIHVVGDIFIHEGELPGWPDSHGCIRVHRDQSERFYALARTGTPVVITH
jgi:hypothetical protein